MTPAESTAASLLDNLKALFNGGTLKLYTGSSPNPANAATGTLLATFTFSATAFGSDTGTSASPVTAAGSFSATTVTAAATGTIGYARALKSDGSTVIADFSVSVTGSGGDLQFGTLSVNSGGNVTLSSFNFSLAWA